MGVLGSNELKKRRRRTDRGGRDYRLNKSKKTEIGKGSGIMRAGQKIRDGFSKSPPAERQPHTRDQVTLWQKL